MTPIALANEVTTQNILSLPDVVLRLNQLLGRPDVTQPMIGELLMSDPAISVRVLKLANCALYGGHGKVDTVSRAVSLLGLERIRGLVMTTFMAQAFDGLPEDVVDMDHFWLNSVASGVMARALGYRCRMFDTELLFLAGLLLKLGRLVFYGARPRQYLEVLQISDLGEEAVIAQERHIFGFDHFALGAELMKLWHLPETLYKLVEEQGMSLAAASFPKELAIVRVASALALTIEPGRNMPEEPELGSIELDQAALDLLDISVDSLQSLTAEAWVQTFEVMETIRPNMAKVF
jgi:HD-like signal output (HDOD) protein